MLSNFPLLRGLWPASGAADPAPVRYRRAKGEEFEAAVRLVLCAGGYADAGQVDEFIRLAQSHADDAGGPHVAEQGGRLISAVLPIASPGRTMLLFVPGYLNSHEQAGMAAHLADLVCRRAAAEGIHLAQCLLEPGDAGGAGLLRSCGFTRLAELLYMQATVPRTPAEPSVPEGHRWVTYAPSTHDLFASTVLGTYQSSLDCPALNGLRHIDDVLAGHRATGEFDPEMWFVLLRHERPVGALLLSPIARTSAVELVYLGVCPGSRGKGMGDVLMRRGTAAVAASGRTRLSLAVDASNTPALKLYWRHGLQALGRKLAMLRDLRGLAGAGGGV